MMWSFRTKYHTLRNVNRFAGWLTSEGGRLRVGLYLRYLPNRCICVFFKEEW